MRVSYAGDKNRQRAIFGLFCCMTVALRLLYRNMVHT